MFLRIPLLRTFALCLLVSVCAPVQAQFLAPKADAVDSAVLAQKRAIEVYLPQEAEKDAKARFETIYVLDGDWNTQVVVNTIAFMRQVGRMPPVIVVSVPNFIDAKGGNSRDTNFLPHVQDGKTKPGSAQDFLVFLKTELIPYVGAHYPANGTNLLHGHSFGGVFAFYALTHEPALFDGYLILDPAMWWGEHALDKVIEAKLPELPVKGKAIYVAARSGRAFEDMGMSTVEPIFKSKAPRGLPWEVTAYPDETHDSLKLKGTYDALKFAYQGYSPDKIELAPMAGIVLKGKPVSLVVNGERSDVRYTTDGSVPNASSPKIDGTLSVADPDQTKVRIVSNRGVFDQDVPHNLKFGSALSPVKPAGDEKKDLWHYAYYPADAWPNLKRAKPFKDGQAKQELDFTEAGRDRFAGSAERNFEVAADGYYVFDAVSPGKMRVAVSGKTLIDHDGTHGRRQQACIVPLHAGTHSVRVEFDHAEKEARVNLVVFRYKDEDPRWWKSKVFELAADAKN